MMRQPTDRLAIAAQLRSAFESMTGLRPQDREQVEVLIAAGELQVALETLCTQIFEYDVALTEGERKNLIALGESLNVRAAYLLGEP